ncbi:Crp/Fnr family transcriptional regulator [Pelagibacterium montanilacus]|uniref:Crp/Fnr family transcriptional regulator n=1 Tax=Pelagibacterium montanilacus TaxID=2185280 RepID=UPI000F8DBAAA|nr:Crp/Fnr family transcriptional regulator [Pelagibacterium montanilacus]
MTRLDIHNSDVPVLCRSCEVRHKGMCGALAPEQLLALAGHTQTVRHKAGTELLADDAEITSYANVMRGVVKLSKMLEDGRQQLVGLQFAPDFLGRLYGSQNALAAEAASDVEICRIPKAALERLVKEYPELEHKLMEQTLRELDEARDWMVTLGRKTAAEKVASFLMLIATHIDPVSRAQAERRALTRTRFDLPLSRADIADFLGLTIETVSRQMTQLRKDGVIEIVNARSIVVPDLARLEARCG